MNVLEAAISTPWAMLPERVEELLSIAARENDIKPEVLEAYRAQAAERGERLKIRDGIGILDITGPLFKRANLFVALSGATSYEILRRDLQAALDDPSVKAIMLRVDSPGGEANGCDELAAAIYEARGKKPITAFVSGMACSGGYWLASAADRIVVSDLAVLGSIGVVLGVEDRSAADEKRGVKKVEFVSSVSPGKRPDVQTDEGKARIQKMVDDLAQVFVSAVAKYRGVSAETVIKNFGTGGVEVGAKAVAFRMADEVGQFETAFAALKSRGSSNRISKRSQGGSPMTFSANGAAATDSNAVEIAKIQANAAANATADTRTRVIAIMNSDEGKARPNLAEHLAFNTDLPPKVAIELMKASTVKVATKDSISKSWAKAAARANARCGKDGVVDLNTSQSDEPKVTVSNGWAKAAEAANQRFGKDGVILS